MKLHRELFWVIAIILLLGATGLLAAPVQPSGELVINEFVASNVTGLTDEDGQTSDWLELHNQSRQAINLAGWALSDDPEKPQKWIFPDLSLGAGDYLVVFASGKDRRQVGADRFLHTNFRLSKAGGFLGLYNIFDESSGDVLTPAYPEQLPDLAYGRAGTLAGYAYLSQPTPGMANDETQAWAGMLAG